MQATLRSASDQTIERALHNAIAARMQSFSQRQFPQHSRKDAQKAQKILPVLFVLRQTSQCRLDAFELFPVSSARC